MKENIKGIFFDLYGTLLIFNDIEKSWYDWAVTFHALINHKTILSFDEFSKKSDSFMNREVVKDIASGLTTYETRIKDYCSSLSINLSNEELEVIANETPHAWQKYISVAGEAHSVLTELKKTKTLALITNFDHTPHIKRTLKFFDLEKYFDAIIISDEVNCCKPDPRIFKTALEKTRLQPDEVIFIGDNLNDDIAGARSAGIEPVLIMHETFTTHHDYKHSADEKSKYEAKDVVVIKSLMELLKI